MKKEWIPLLFLTTFALVFVQTACSQKIDKISPIQVLPKSGSKVTGQVQISENSHGVLLAVHFKGLSPNQLHGFHVHENGDCSSADGSSAGGHFAPVKHPHGGPHSPQRHLGDLGNLKSNAQGEIIEKIVVHGANLKASDKNSIKNRSVILHAKKDDLKSQPSGNSGPRIACAVLTTD